MQPLENNKDPFKVLRGDSKAVVPHGKDPFLAAVFLGGDVYMRSGCTAVLNCVPNEVLKYLHQLGIVGRK